MFIISDAFILFILAIAYVAVREFAITRTRRSR